MAPHVNPAPKAVNMIFSILIKNGKKMAKNGKKWQKMAKKAIICYYNY
jgi:hypothetical protein